MASSATKKMCSQKLDVFKILVTDISINWHIFERYILASIVEIPWKKIVNLLELQGLKVEMGRFFYFLYFRFFMASYLSVSVAIQNLVNIYLVFRFIVWI